MKTGVAILAYAATQTTHMTTQTAFDFGIKSEMVERFEAFDQENPHVYQLFDRFTLHAIDAGRTRFSAWAVVNRIRWFTSIETTDADYKINNDFIALYARKFMRQRPQYDGFFSIKEMTRI